MRILVIPNRNSAHRFIPDIFTRIVIKTNTYLKWLTDALYFYLISEVSELLNSHDNRLNKPKIEWRGNVNRHIFLCITTITIILALNTEATYLYSVNNNLFALYDEENK